MRSLFACFPLLSGACLYLSLQGRWRLGASLAFACGILVIAVGFDPLFKSAATVYALVFLCAAVLPLIARADLQRVSRDNLSHKLYLQAEVYEAQWSWERGLEKRMRLLESVDQMSKRYAFTRSLVANLDEKPILQDLGAILASEKIVLGLAYSNACVTEKDLTLFDFKDGQPETATSRVSWKPLYTSGWVTEENWENILESVEFSMDESTSSVVVDLLGQRAPSAFSDFRRFLRISSGDEHGDSLYLVGMPVRWDGKIQGLLTCLLQNALPDEFLEELTVYAQLLGLGLRKSALYRMVLEHSRRDGLTNLYLRHILMERLGQEISFTRRYGTSFSLLMLDLDYFKTVNDTYGHQGGDQVLKAVAECLRSTLHSGVTICRYGGEEFAVLVGLAPREEVLATAERVRKAVESLRISLDDGREVRITLSAGVAHYLPEAPAVEELINRADTALYHAKEGGRNRVCEWKGEEPGLLSAIGNA